MAKDSLLAHNVNFINIQKLHQCTNSSYVCVLLPTAHRLTFAMAVFSDLSDIHECLGSLQLTLAAIATWLSVTHHITGRLLLMPFRSIGEKLSKMTNNIEEYIVT